MIAASDLNSALGLDLADGVLDGNFFGTKIGVSNAPVYKTPVFGATSGLGLLGATTALSMGSYPASVFSAAPTFSAFPTSAFSASAFATSAYSGLPYTAPTLTSLPTTSYVGTYTEAATTLPSAYPMPFYPTMASAVTSTAYPSVVRPAYPVVPSVVQPTYVQQMQCIPCQQVLLPPPTVEYQVVAAPPPMQIQYIQAPPEIRYVQTPPEIRYVQTPPEIRYIEAPAKPAEPVEPVEDPKWKLQIAEFEAEILILRKGQEHMRAMEEEMAAMRARLNQMRAMEEELMALRNALQRARGMEEEIAHLRQQLAVKSETHSRTSKTETYKVKTFEMAVKLAVMDGTDDGLYNGLPIEVEGEGLYRDLVAQGRKAKAEVSLSGHTGSMTTSKETYKVKSFEMAEKLSRMDGTDDGLYNGLPIEIVGEGLYKELVAAGRKSTVTSTTTTTGHASTSGAVTTSSTTSQGTYKVSSYEMAEKLSKMDGTDDGLYNGLPIEVAGQGLFREARAKRTAPAS